MQLSQARGGSKRGMGGTGRKTDPSGPRPNVSLHLDVPPMPLFDPPLASAPSRSRNSRFSVSSFNTTDSKCNTGDSRRNTANSKQKTADSKQKTADSRRNA